MTTARLILGDCLAELPKLAAGSVDAVITDPPYPEIDRPYGRWTEAEWFAMTRVVVPECMRILKPRGSAVFILQPNSERVGRMRTWLWEFMAWVGKEWGVVQDAWWWNIATMPSVGATQDGLLRGSLKACVWLGSPDCYRAQDRVLWHESEENIAHRLYHRGRKDNMPSGHQTDYDRQAGAAVRRGGTTPFNVLPIPGADWKQSRSAGGHPGMTPLDVAEWWTRYLCPPGGIILDPFAGTSTVGLAAQQRDCSYIGIERVPEYHAIAQRRLAEAPSAAPLFDPPAPVQPALFPEGAA